MNGVPTTYTLDLAAGLTQVLSDGTNAYLYGNGRVGEQQAGGWQYHLGDALGSVRQLATSTGAVSLARSYEPFGSVMSSLGSASTAFSFTGEQRDGTGLVYLRARYYAPDLTQWIQPDPIVPEPDIPADRSRHAHVRNNPVNNTDPGAVIRWGTPSVIRLSGTLFRLLFIRLCGTGQSSKGEDLRLWSTITSMMSQNIHIAEEESHVHVLCGRPRRCSDWHQVAR